MNILANRRLSHLTPYYVLKRMAVMYYEYRNPQHPWLTADAVKILSSMLLSTDIGVEYGSGRSTKWFAQRLQHLTSIENDSNWFYKVNQSLVDLPNKAGVDYRLCVSDEEYAAQPYTFTDNSIDFCLIDGAVRDHCALAMLPKIRAGGIIVVDNANWFLPNDYTKSPNSRRKHEGFASETWELFASEVSGFRRIWTTNGIWDTAIWIKC